MRRRTAAHVRPRKRPGLYLYASALMLLLLTPARAAAQTYDVGGRTVEVALSADKPSVMLGEPVYLSFEVRNLSGEDLQVMVGGDYRNALGRPESFRVEVVGEDGRAVPQPDAGMGMGGLSSGQKIPAGGKYVFKLFLPHWATFDAPGEYTISCRRSLSLAEYGADFSDKAAWRSVDVEAATKVRVTPRDDAALGEVIESWAGELSQGMSAKENYVENSARASRAVKALAAIDDPRTVKHLTAVMESDSGSFDGLKFEASRALARYETGAALAALKAAATDKDDNVRHAVANALSAGKHAGAFDQLLSMRRDSNYAVRLTVVHALGKKNSDESAALLRVMAGDENEMVRREALRYLNERGAKPRE